MNAGPRVKHGVSRRTGSRARGALALVLLGCAACASNPAPRPAPQTMRVVLMRHRPASAVVLELPLMRPSFVGASVTVDEGRNALLVRGPAAAVDAVCQAIAKRDVPDDAR